MPAKVGYTGAMTAASTDTSHAPHGWLPFTIEEGFIGVNGPLFVRRSGDGIVLGMRVEARHCNPNGMCHGGMLMTFADMMLPIGARYAAQMPAVFLPTINLSMDYLAPAPLGAWLEGRARVLRVTRNLVFADGLITMDETIVARTSGTFKIGKPLAGLSVFDELIAKTAAPD